MTKRLLVAYASGTGSTAEVADVIGEVLAVDDVLVDVEHVRDVASVEPFSGVVVGSSIRAGRWLPDGVRFVEMFAADLAERHVAYFTTCLTMVEDTEEARRTVLAYLEPVRQLAPEVEPIGLGLFAGSLSPTMRLVTPGAGPYGDFRDWDAIRAWAAEIRPLLLAAVPGERASLVLRGSVMSFTDLADADLRGLDMRRTKLHEADLARADLRGADLRRSDLSGADLRQAHLEAAQLGWADLKRADLRGATLREANLIGAELQHADLRGADLVRAVLNGVNFTDARLDGAALRRADLNWAVLSGANLSDADLSKASLGWADLGSSHLARANLSGTRYNEQTKWPEDFSPQEAGCTLVKGPR